MAARVEVFSHGVLVHAEDVDDLAEGYALLESYDYRRAELGRNRGRSARWVHPDGKTARVVPV